MKKILTLAAGAILISLCTTLQGTAQSTKPDYSEFPYWTAMMLDPSVNFYDVQEAFYAYWDGREITRSNGYKPFKRWEYRMRWRVKPDGERYPENHAWTSSS